MLDRLSKPHYVFRPDQLIRRGLLPGSDEPLVRTSWGARLRVARADRLGAGIARTGVHELAVSEMIWRLAGGDALAIDVGANIGYFSVLLAARARQVVAFEPNPRLKRLLAENIQRGMWRERIVLDTRAVSNVAGRAPLNLPPGYEQNYGLASLGPASGGDSFVVQTVRLDEVIGNRHVGVLKLDVEGHEMAALEGASDALAAGLIRDVVFEEHRPLPSPVSELLESRGYGITGIEERLIGPRLSPADRTPRGWDAPTYLATLEPRRAARLAAARGWRCLRPRQVEAHSALAP
jgi:FkbM family methyltransferase